VYDDYMKIHETLYIGLLGITRTYEWLSFIFYIKFFRDGIYADLCSKMQFLLESKHTHTQPRL